MKYSRGKNPNSRNGFKKGHVVIPGTEATRFKKGRTSWNKGMGVGTNPTKLKYRTYKSNAKKRGLVFNVSFDEFTQYILSDCFYCPDKSTGIDRVDNSQGYIIGNMVPCCGTCNHMKWNLTQEVFIQKCKEIINKSSDITVTGYEI